ncbi:hypothetical protein GCM10011611_18080 [Aliidongia dinghuensis]|uniref:Uncharacterized protein n=1 Tax=Aliidongia dinghuensis TaxID=1867774 RepID=A0A8J2YRM5_9PROT|nr:hypothetical protein [Aliidongia dinghuensis]GGF12803.1 hypothetical protein GCM10011611_18080 [Aliidongia dinghuensis]
MTSPFRTKSLVSLLALVLASPALAAGASDSSTRTVGPQQDGSIVASDNQLLTPAGRLVSLGAPVVAKAIAVNPNKTTKTAAVLLMSAAQPVLVFNTETGQVIQSYIPTTASGKHTQGSFTGMGPRQELFMATR